MTKPEDNSSAAGAGSFVGQQAARPASKAAIIKAIGGLQKYAKQCHVASLAIVNSGLLPATARVARGFHPAMMSQHSWVVLGNPYDPTVKILDPTLWSYTNERPYLLSGTADKLAHAPHGAGSIWNFGRPEKPTGKIIKLKGVRSLSYEAQKFLRILGPLDWAGWHVLASKCPVGDWPAAEIIGAMSETPTLSALVPIDRLGMLTDKNPGGLYMAHARTA